MPDQRDRLPGLQQALASTLGEAGIEPRRIHDAQVPASGAGRQRLWGRTLALLPQEPWRSLDPTMRTVEQEQFCS